jgi:hypothetical protein
MQNQLATVSADKTQYEIRYQQAQAALVEVLQPATMAGKQLIS